MKRLGILLLCLSIGGSPVLMAMNGRVVDKRINSDVLAGFAEQTRSLSTKELHDLEHAASTGDETAVGRWDLHCELSYEGFKAAFDECHKGKPNDTATASQLKKMVSYLYDYNIKLACASSGKQIKTVFPFRSTITHVFWAIANGKLQAPKLKKRGIYVRFPKIMEFHTIWEALDAEQEWGGLTSCNGGLTKEMVLSLVLACTNIAKKGGLDNPAKKVDLAALGSSFVVGDTSVCDKNFSDTYLAGIKDQSEEGDQSSVDEKKPSKLKKVFVGAAALGAAAITILFGKKVYDGYKEMKDMKDQGKEVLDKAGNVLDKPHKILAKAVKNVGQDAWQGGAGLVVKGWKCVKRLFCGKKCGGGEYIEVEMGDIEKLKNADEGDIDKIINKDKEQEKKIDQKVNETAKPVNIQVPKPIVKPKVVVNIPLPKLDDTKTDEKKNSFKKELAGRIGNLGGSPTNNNTNSTDAANPDNVKFDFDSLQKRFDDLKKNDNDDPLGGLDKANEKERKKVLDEGKKKCNDKWLKKFENKGNGYVGKERKQNDNDTMITGFEENDDQTFYSCISEIEKTEIRKDGKTLEERLDSFVDDNLSKAKPFFLKKEKERKQTEKDNEKDDQNGRDTEKSDAKDKEQSQPENQPANKGLFTWGWNGIKDGYNFIGKAIVSFL